ncbi:MAG: flagellar motor switch protein FliN [Proteobacteria bacterium]|nr:flagellar motor switch protein FliN [Pseudomonadota bacterium]
MNENTEHSMRKILGDVPVPVRCHLGWEKMAVREIMELEEGALISLGTLIGEPIDITVAGRPIARGEVVIVNDRYGVRVSEIV